MTYLTLFLTALISATLFPMGSEALLLYNLNQNYNIYLLLIVASIGNTLGSVINYFLGLKGSEFLISKKFVKEKYLLSSEKYFNRYGSISLLFSWLPIVGDPLTFIAGVLKYNFFKFLIIVLIAKSVRYIFIAFSYTQLT